MSKKLIVIQGPTGIGKTKVAILLAKKFETEIISTDSRQFYKELLIGAAPPSKKQLLEAKHHFIHNLSVKEDYNVGKFSNECEKKIYELFKQRNKIITVGGSGMYTETIANGLLDNIPEIDISYKKNIISKYKTYGINFLQKELEKHDKNYFNIVDKKNPHRLIRALEVFYATGNPFSAYRKKNKRTRNFTVIKIGLIDDRETLYNKLDTRVDIMFEKGLIDEVQKLLKYRNKNALKSVGYTEVINYLDNEISLEETIKLIKRNSRRLAKRQITWMKRDKDILYFNPKELEKIYKAIE